MPPRDPVIQISQASYRGSSSTLIGIISILSRLFPLHVGEIRKLLVRAAALTVAVITAAIAIARRPFPRASSSQQCQTRGSPSTSPPPLSLDFASSSYSLRLVRSTSFLAHQTIVPAPPSSSHPLQPMTNISFPHHHPNNCRCSLHLHRKKFPRQKDEGQRSHAGKGNGVFKSTFRHDSLLTASSGLWAPHSNRCSRIDTKPQAHVQL